MERVSAMDFREGVLVSLFVMALVFALLAAIYALVKLTSAIIRRCFDKMA